MNKLRSVELLGREQLCGERGYVLRARKRSSERMAMAFTSSTETVEVGR
jgi:hypothetical protein